MDAVAATVTNNSHFQFTWCRLCNLCQSNTFDFPFFISLLEIRFDNFSSSQIAHNLLSSHERCAATFKITNIHIFIKKRKNKTKIIMELLSHRYCDFSVYIFFFSVIDFFPSHNFFQLYEKSFACFTAQLRGLQMKIVKAPRIFLLLLYFCRFSTFCVSFTLPSLILWKFGSLSPESAPGSITFEMYLFF
jgi:hypothetical protein